MKKLVLAAVIAVFSLVNANAQDGNFGITAGFHNFTIKGNGNGVTASTSASGFFAGFSAEFQVSDEFNIQPEFHFVQTSKNGDTAEQIVIPVIGKYYVSDKFNLQAGPQFDYIISESSGTNKFGLGLAIGAGYDFSDKIFATTRYAFGVTNRLENAPSNVSVKFDTFQIGLGYRF